jgi:hypothetical protein
MPAVRTAAAIAPVAEALVVPTAAAAMAADRHRLRAPVAVQMADRMAVVQTPAARTVVVTALVEALAA